jgi:hypothetical protein
MSTKTKNPLFVVTNDGQDVEQASGLFDAFVKKLGLEPLLEIFDEILEQIIAACSNYAMIEVLSAWLEQITEGLENLIKMIDPLLAFQLFKR